MFLCSQIEGNACKVIETPIVEEEPPEEIEFPEPLDEPEEEDIFAGDENLTANDCA